MTRMNERTARPEVAPYLGRARCPHRAAFGFAYFACFAGNPCFIRVPSVAKVGLPVGRSTMPRFFPMLAGWLVPEAQASIFQTGCGRGTYQTSHCEKFDFSGFCARQRMNSEAKFWPRMEHGMNTENG